MLAAMVVHLGANVVTGLHFDAVNAVAIAFFENRDFAQGGVRVSSIGIGSAGFQDYFKGLLSTEAIAQFRFTRPKPHQDRFVIPHEQRPF